jgi:hypothetical protein
VAATGTMAVDQLEKSVSASRLLIRSRLQDLERRHGFIRQEQGTISVIEPALRAALEEPEDDDA